MDNILTTLLETRTDDALVRRFLSVWPSIESILDSFSQATSLPTFVFLNRVKIFQSSTETLPSFCTLMLGDPHTEMLCTQDGIRRIEGEEPEFTEGFQLCHAGLVNGRRELDTGCVGKLSIVYGSRPSANQISIERKRAVIQETRLRSPALADSLKRAADTTVEERPIYERDIKLLDGILDILNRLLRATVDIHSLTINLTHELSVMMLGIGLLARETTQAIEGTRGSTSPGSLDEIHNMQSHLFTECQLALFTVRNFLSHVSETRYSQVVRPRFTDLNLNSILQDMIDLYRRHALSKQIIFDLSGLPDLPKIKGAEMEIRRLFHNVLSNAVKYSYHSIPLRQRTIRIRAKVPYDPGFKLRRFSVLFENYGLGITKAEKHRVFESGFRGQQAIAEMPVGAGIGLSEALKIMRVHGGDIKFSSKELHKDLQDETYLTRIELLFPFKESGS